MAGLTAVPHVSRERDAEMQQKQIACPLEGSMPFLHVLRPSQAQVGKVMQRAAKDALTVLRVLRGVEDVGLPHLINCSGRDNGTTRVKQAQRQELAVLDDCCVRFRQCLGTCA